MSLIDRTAMKTWKHKGLNCALVVQPSGYINGYVQIPKSHPWFGLGYDERHPLPLGVEMRVLPTVTYSDLDGWLGFDTNHSHDVWTIEALEAAGVEVTDHMREMISLNPLVPGDHGRRWDLGIVIAETSVLAEEILAGQAQETLRKHMEAMTQENIDVVFFMKSGREIIVKGVSDETVDQMTAQIWDMDVITIPPNSVSSEHYEFSVPSIEAYSVHYPSGHPKAENND